VIAVASNGITGKRAFYSNYGTTVTLSAPGGGVYPNDGTSGTPDATGYVFSAINDGETTPAGENYAGYAGTSQASPHVAGAVAMILGATHAAGMDTPTPAQIRDILVRSARPFPLTQDHPVGAGILDAHAAVNLALGNDDGGGDEQAIPLAKGVILPGQAGAPGSSALYSITVPAGASMLNVRTMGGTGDVTLYVKAGSAPGRDGSDADFTSARPGNNDALVLATPQAATYYIRVAAGASPYANVSVLADYKP
jgi:serine protease